MDSRTTCAFNLTRDAALSLNVTVANPSHEHLKIIEFLIDGFGSGSEAALLLTPLSGTPKVPRLFACEVVFLDRDLRVVLAIDAASRVDFPPWSDRVESALYLRARTLASTQTQQGDQLTVCDVAAVEYHRQSFSPPKVAASECKETSSQDPASVEAKTAPVAILLGDSNNVDSLDEQVPQPPELAPAESSLPQNAESPPPSLIPAAAFEAIESFTGSTRSVRFALSTPVDGRCSNQFTLNQSPSWQIAEPPNLIPSLEPEQSALETFEPDAELPSGELPGWTKPIRTSCAGAISSAAASAPVDALREVQPQDYPSGEFAIWRPALTAAPSAIVQSIRSETAQTPATPTHIQPSPAIPEAAQPSRLPPLPAPILDHSLEEPHIPESEKQAPKEAEGPRFFIPTPIRFFDPASDSSEDGVSDESSNGDPFNADPATRSSSHLSPELQAVILQLTDNEKQKGRDRDSLGKFAPVNSKPPAQNLKSGKERA